MNASPSPERFAVSRATLFADRFMGVFIRIGGAGVIAAVFGILVFIVAQVFPLFGDATIAALRDVKLGAPAGAVIGSDEHGELPFFATLSGDFTYVDAMSGERTTKHAALPEGFVPAILASDDRNRTVLFAAGDGKVVSSEPGYTSAYDDKGTGRTVADPVVVGTIDLGVKNITGLRFADAGDTKLFVVTQGAGDAATLSAVTVKTKKGLGGKTRSVVGEPVALSAPEAGPVAGAVLAASGDSVLVADRKGEVFWFLDEGEGFALAQRFTPFPGKPVADMGFVFGDQSVSFSDVSGANVVWSLYQQEMPGEEHTRRLWGQTKTLPATSGAPSLFARTENNKCYLLAGDGFASIRHSTTERVRADIPLDFKPRAAALSRHYDRAWFLDDKGDMRRFAIRDPHPEAGFAAFFGKIRYEGASEAAYSWQSTSGNDDFEPKLSMVPLMFGTIKGTLYALVFAVPVALLGALYTSQFMRPGTRAVVKPAIELMASLPSVVLGFLAALWLAPKVEFAVPGMALACVATPLAAMLFGYVWARLPKRVRILVGPGNEFVAVIPLVILAAWLAWRCGPAFEHAAFAGDFPAWWRAHVGPYEQRNCLVVGFIMGFAVIPIVYTIAEDSLSNVPKSLVSASLALGASRWQTARHVVLPTASAGIFSALMIGFGRAVGETMIVVMATGNTAITEWNIFNGMRTASANIAVELPEAAVGSTHYRTLFLCACCLFVLTFALNTAAETLRSRLREKYKVV